MDEDPKELEDIIRSLSLRSKTVLSANKLHHEFEEIEGRKFPFRKLGFSSFVDYLKSIPCVVKLVPPYSANPDVLPFATEHSKHMDELISKQRNPVPKKSRPSRRGGYNGRITTRRDPVPIRRRPTNMHAYVPTRRPTPVMDVDVSNVQAKYEEKSQNAEYHKKEVYFQDHLSAGDAVKYTGEYPSSDDAHEEFSSNLNTNSFHPTLVVENSGYNGNSYDGFDDDWSDVSEEDVSNFTINHFSQVQTTSHENGRNPTDAENQNIDLDDDKISTRMKRNFQKILELSPSGVWASEFSKIYSKEFGVPLDVQDLGFSNIMMLASSLPSIFCLRRVGESDYKFYDARLEKLSGYENEQDYTVEEHSIPQAIVEDIKKLVSQHPKGVRSTDLIDLYKEQFRKSLDLETLGYRNVEDFVEQLEKEITLRQVRDYYVLQPKHKIMSLESNENQEKESESPFTKLDYVMDVLLPNSVLKMDETIPVQNLPPFKSGGSPKDPLLEMEVRVAEIITPGYFFILLNSKYNELECMMEDLDNFYKTEEENYKIPVAYLNINLHCACIYGEYWHRAKIVGFNKTGLIDIQYIDYGTPEAVKGSQLRFLHKDFSTLPAQARCAKLTGVKPPENRKTWPKTSSHKFLSMVNDKRLVAHIYAVGEKTVKDVLISQIEVVLFDTANERKQCIINEDLVAEKLAEFNYGVVQKDINDFEYCSVSVLSEEQDDTDIKPSQHSPTSSQPKEIKKVRVPPGFETVKVGSEERYSNTAISRSYSQQQPAAVPAITFQNMPVPDNKPHQIPTNNFNSGQLPPNFPGLIPPYNNVLNNMAVHLNPFNQPFLMPQYPSQLPIQPNQFNLYQNSNFTTQNPNLQSSLDLNFNSSLISQAWNNGMLTFNGAEYMFTQTPQPVIYPNLPPPASLLLNSVPQQVPITTREVKNRTHQPSSSVTQHISVSPCIAELQELKNLTSTQPSANISGTQPTKNIKFTDTMLTTNINVKEGKPKSECNSKDIFSNSLRTVLSQLPLESVTAEHQGITSVNSNETNCSESANNFDENSFTKPSVMNNKNNLSQNLTFVQDSEKILSDECTFEVDEKDHINNNELTTEDNNLKQLDMSKQTEISQPVNIPSACEIVPESWEDIEPDDTPASVDNFLGYFKRPINRDIIQQTPELDISSRVDNFKRSDIDLSQQISELNISCSDNLKMKEAPVNWKDTFNPDIDDRSKRCDNTPDSNKSLKLLNVDMKKELVHKIEIGKKVFHLIYINNRLALLPFELYPQVTSLQMHTVCHVLELKQKHFPVISKKDYPHLFSELDKIKFHPNVDKKKIIKFGKANITYLSDIPDTFNLLQLRESDQKQILEEIKKISQEFGKS